MLVFVLRTSMLMLLSLASCEAPPTLQQCAKLMTDQAIIERCGSPTYGNEKRTEDCFPLTKPERITGLVIRENERSELFVGASRVKPEMRGLTQGVWLEWSKSAEGRPPHAIQYGAYLILFEGRRSACSQPGRGLNGYGHLNQYRELAIVDHIISWTRVAD